jgi:hypothetical protein
MCQCIDEVITKCFALSVMKAKSFTDGQVKKTVINAKQNYRVELL